MSIEDIKTFFAIKMNNNQKNEQIKDWKYKGEAISFLFKRRMYKNTLFTLVYAVVTAIVGMFIMSFLYDIKINFIYGAILAGWLFLITFLFLLVKLKKQKDYKIK